MNNMENTYLTIMTITFSIIITFTTKKGKSVTYNHDKVYEVNKDRFESMNCFKKYKSYTNSNNIPTFCRDI